MHKSKEEQLKEVLNKTLSKEEIEKRLKEEIKHKKEEAKIDQQNYEPSIEKEIYIKEESLPIKENLLEEEVIIPTVRDKKKNEKSGSIIFYIIIIILLLLGILAYLYIKDITEKKRNQQKINLEITKDKKELIINKEETLVSKVINTNEVILDNKEDDKVKITETIINNEENDNNKINEIVKNKEENNDNNKVNKTIEDEENFKLEEQNQAKVETKEKVVVKEVKVNKRSFKKYYNSDKYNLLKCYDYKAADIFPDSSCKKDLKKFLENNKDALRIEIIPVIGKEDHKLFDKIKDRIKDMDIDFQEKVKEYLVRGLSRERVLEISWEIKNILGEDTVLTPTNYYVKSPKENKGVLIRAYH